MRQAYSGVIEPAGRHFSADVSDFPGCVATAAIREVMLEERQQAAEFHLHAISEERDATE